MFQRRESSSTSSRRESSNFKSSSCRVDLRALVDRAVIHLVGCRGGNEWLEGGPMKPTARLSSGIAAPSTCVAWTSWLPRIVVCVVRSSQDQQAGRRQGGLSYSGAGAPAQPGPIPDGPPPPALGSPARQSRPCAKSCLLRVPCLQEAPGRRVWWRLGGRSYSGARFARTTFASSAARAVRLQRRDGGEVAAARAAAAPLKRWMLLSEVVVTRDDAGWSVRLRSRATLECDERRLTVGAALGLELPDFALAALPSTRRPPHATHASWRWCADGCGVCESDGSLVEDESSTFVLFLVRPAFSMFFFA